LNKNCNKCAVPLEVGVTTSEKRLDNHMYACITCSNKKSKESNRKRRELIRADPTRAQAYWEQYEWLKMVEGRAKRIGVPFDLTADDVVIPDVCPILKIPMSRHTGGGSGPRAGSPTFDRIVPAKGYVRGNVRIISHRANNMRGKRTPEECLKMLTSKVNAKKAAADPNYKAEILRQRMLIAAWMYYGDGYYSG
jgi:hypothetical protein